MMVASVPGLVRRSVRRKKSVISRPILPLFRNRQGEAGWSVALADCLHEVQMPQREEFLEYFLANQLELRAFVSAIIRDRNACDDVFQEVSQTLWQDFDKFDRSRSFSAWARGIARYKVLHVWRKAKKNPVLLSEGAIDAVCRAYEETEPDGALMSEALRRCLEGLPENSKRLVEWRYEASLQLGEIADRLQTSLGAVNKALFRLRANLQSCVEKKMSTVETE
ncbi:MAG: hypothetical protein C0404_04840 [Verrucomicrobia bacterium]|nr:hypothetical protein [Verrucomicrobiota bacterium]